MVGSMLPTEPIENNEEEDSLYSISIKKKKERMLKFNDQTYQTNLQQTFGHDSLDNYKFDNSSDESDKKEKPTEKPDEKNSSGLKDKKTKKSKKKKQISQVEPSSKRMPKLRSADKKITNKMTSSFMKKISTIFERIQRKSSHRDLKHRRIVQNIYFVF